MPRPTTSVPPAGRAERQLGTLVGTWRDSLVNYGLRVALAPGVWTGKWILDGHVVCLSANKSDSANAPRELYLFGYSGQSRRHFMMKVTADSLRGDHADVSWFTIDAAGTWRSAPAPAADPRIRRLSPWVGVWHNRHEESQFSVDGPIDSRIIAGGDFISWFEADTLRYRSGRVAVEREVDVWGYSETARLYWRVDVGLGVPPTFGESFWWQSDGSGVVLVSVLEEEHVGDRIVPSRFGFDVASPDTMTVFSERLDDGVHWAPYAPGTLKWPRIR